VNASFHSVPLAMTNTQLILPKYLYSLRGEKIADFSGLYFLILFI